MGSQNLAVNSQNHSSTPTLVIEVRGLTKRFDTVQAVVCLDFAVQSGELFGFLGPNGAGKTTTINMLTGLSRPDGGTIRMAGIDCSTNPKAAQHLLGIVPDESNLYPELTGFENLCFCAALYGMPKAERQSRAHALLETFGLTQAAHRRFGGYSKGMKRKLTIAAGIIHQPAILFLDEPTTAIDIASARQVRQIIADLHAAGTTVFLTTHYIEEAERLCDRIAFVVNGQIVHLDTMDQLLESSKGKSIVQISWETSQPGFPTHLEANFPHFTFEQETKSTLRVESADRIFMGPLIRFLEDQGFEVTEARRIRPSLEDVFVHITGLHVEAMKREKEKGGNAP